MKRMITLLASMVFATALALPLAGAPVPAPQIAYCPPRVDVVPRAYVVRPYVVRRHFKRDYSYNARVRRERFARFGRR